MKIIGMIPARIGSQRVKKKNLRLLHKRPLIDYILEAASKVEIFDHIYLNSDDEIFAELCEPYGITYYKRPQKFATDTSTNDEFAEEFLSKIDCDILIQMLPTSPFVVTKDINNFISYMLEDNFETLVSVEHKQIACVYESEPINFEKLIPNPPSQMMKPIKVYATALMGWKSERFLKNMRKYGSAYHGGVSKTGFFELKGLSTIDIDSEEDFNLAESIMISKSYPRVSKPEYYSGIQEHIEEDKNEEKE